MPCNTGLQSITGSPKSYAQLVPCETKAKGEKLSQSRTPGNPLSGALDYTVGKAQKNQLLLGT